MTVRYSWFRLARHQVTQQNIVQLLDAYATQTGGFVVASPIDIVFSDYDVLQPDVVFFSAARRHLDGRLTVIRPPDVALRYTVVTPDTRVPMPPPARVVTRRPRRNTGLGRWPKPEVQFASLFPKRTDHVSNG
jgi:hypothetical protein